MRIEYAASSTLARQIIAGNHVDLFISASPEWAEVVINALPADIDTSLAVFSNRLAIIQPEASQFKLSHLLAIAEQPLRIAIGDPEHVPVGQYAMSALQQAGLWQKISKRIVPAPNARVAVTWVEQGELDAGIVFESDVIVASKARLAFVFPDSLQPDIRYIAVAFTPTGRQMALQYLNNPGLREHFKRAGFRPLAAEAN